MIVRGEILLTILLTWLLVDTLMTYKFVFSDDALIVLIDYSYGFFGRGQGGLNDQDLNYIYSQVKCNKPWTLGQVFPRGLQWDWFN